MLDMGVMHNICQIILEKDHILWYKSLKIKKPLLRQQQRL